MYETFYGLRGKPFSLLPDHEFLYLGETHRTALSLLEYGLICAAPFIVLTGEPGMGKTSLLQKIISEHRDQYSIGYVTNARYDVEHLLPWILLAFGLSQTQLEPVEAYHTFSEFLVRESKRNRRAILIVDEAQSLGVDLLEELRLLSNMNEGKVLRLQIILSGQPDLHTLLQRLDMIQFAQRVVVDYHLKPFTEEEVVEYIRYRVHAAGGKPSLFTNQACALAHRLSEGNPRLINQICEMTLTYGFAEQAHRVTARLLAQAALDRRKNGVLPLAGQVDLTAVITAPEELEEQTESESPSLLLTEPFPDSPKVTPETLYQTGLMLRRTQEFKAAIEQFEQAAEDPSYHLKAFAQVGLCYRASGQPHQAVLAYRKALADQSAPVREGMMVRYSLGMTLEYLEEISEALENYRKVYRMDRSFREVAWRISRLENQHMRPGSARQMSNGSFLQQVWQRLQQMLKPSR